MKKIVYLSLGSNLGDRQANLRNAIGHLLDLGDVLDAEGYLACARSGYGSVTAKWNQSLT